MDSSISPKNWRWDLLKFNKEQNLDSTLLVIATFLALAIFEILIFILIATIIQKFFYKAETSVETVLEPTIEVI